MTVFADTLQAGEWRRSGGIVAHPGTTASEFRTEDAPGQVLELSVEPEARTGFLARSCTPVYGNVMTPRVPIERSPITGYSQAQQPASF